MRQIKFEAKSPESQLAMDEALLMAAEAGGGEAIRIWEFDCPTLILGRSSKWESEVNHPFCQRHSIPVLRRCSGGASVVGGPGCMMYSVVLSFAKNPSLQKIDQAHLHVMSRVLAAVKASLPAGLTPHADEVRLQGTCDLTWRNRKISGNSLRVARKHLLYHGTILYASDLSLIAQCLSDAPRQPEYRKGRSHGDFIDNLPIRYSALESKLLDQFGPNQVAGPTAQTIELHEQLLDQRYGHLSWHQRH